MKWAALRGKNENPVRYRRVLLPMDKSEKKKKDFDFLRGDIARVQINARADAFLVFADLRLAPSLKQSINQSKHQWHS